MNLSNSNQTDTDAEMDNDQIVQLYRRVLATETTPASLDKAILESYKQAFKPPFWKRWLCKRNLSGELVFNWQIANALAIGLVIGIIIPRIHPEQLKPELTKFRGGTTKPVENQNVTKNPQIWLEKIANLIYEGDIKQAEQELAKFKQQYPDYKPQ